MTRLLALVEQAIGYWRSLVSMRVAYRRLKSRSICITRKVRSLCSCLPQKAA
jgi:ABC-type protease/lipase transport system fused ATPase/permease subunit